MAFLRPARAVNVKATQMDTYMVKQNDRTCKVLAFDPDVIAMLIGKMVHGNMGGRFPDFKGIELGWINDDYGYTYWFGLKPPFKPTDAIGLNFAEASKVSSEFRAV